MGRKTHYIWLLWAAQKEHESSEYMHTNIGAYLQRLRLDSAGVKAEMSFCWPHMPDKTRFLMTIYDLVLQWQPKEDWFFTSDVCGLTNRAFQHFRLSHLSVRSTQTLFSLRSSFIYLLSAACYMLQIHVPCYRNKFQCFLFLLLLFTSLKSNLCSFHMKTFLPSCRTFAVCLINTVLVCLITSPVSDTNVISKWR